MECDITEAGFKYHMNNVNATIGLVQLECLNENVRRYIENGQFFDQNLKNIPGVTLLSYYADTDPSYWLYTLKVERRDDFIAMMAENGVAASPLHLRNDRHSVFDAPTGKTPALDAFYESFVHIPSRCWVTEDDRDLIVNAIRRGW